MSLNDLIQWLSGFLSVSSQTPATGQVPVGEGWLALGVLFAVFGALVWWLYGSPLPESGEPVATSAMGPRARLILSGLVLLSGVLFTAGGRWDELWHRIYGGFGDDFLWPPHLLIYGALGLNSAFAGFGLVVAARGSGGIRARFRANPLVGLLGLLAAYELASIPSDLIWHRIIGPDISAWALPHFLLTASASAVLLIGIALCLSTRPRRSWRIVGKPDLVDLVALALLAVSTLNLLQIGVTEWEWDWISAGPFSMPFDRPVWAYPVVVLLVGLTEAQLIVHLTRRIGAATALAVAVLAIQWILIGVARSLYPPGPHLVSHLLLLFPAVAIDLWYATRLPRAQSMSTAIGGALAYAAVLLVATEAFLRLLLPYPVFSLTDYVAIVSIGAFGAVLTAVAARSLGDWFNRQVPELTPRRPSSTSYARRAVSAVR